MKYSQFKQAALSKQALTSDDIVNGLKTYGNKALEFAQQNPGLTATGVGIGSGLLAALVSPRGKKLANFLRGILIGGGGTYVGINGYKAYKYGQRRRAGRRDPGYTDPAIRTYSNTDTKNNVPADPNGEKPGEFAGKGGGAGVRADDAFKDIR